jgi:hypothetical protein
MPVTVDPPKHPLPAMTTYELRDYRRQLEQTIAILDQAQPRDRWQAALDSVVAEQDERARLARA